MWSRKTAYTCTDIKTRTFSDRSFAAAGPRAWNELPFSLRDTGLLLTTFNAHLKTYLFSTVFEATAHLWHLWFLCAAYKCTYLLTYNLQITKFHGFPGLKNVISRPVSSPNGVWGGPLENLKFGAIWDLKSHYRKAKLNTFLNPYYKHAVHLIMCKSYQGLGVLGVKFPGPLLYKEFQDFSRTFKAWKSQHFNFRTFQGLYEP